MTFTFAGQKFRTFRIITDRDNIKDGLLNALWDVTFKKFEILMLR